MRAQRCTHTASAKYDKLFCTQLPFDWIRSSRPSQVRRGVEVLTIVNCIDYYCRRTAPSLRSARRCAQTPSITFVYIVSARSNIIRIRRKRKRAARGFHTLRASFRHIGVHHNNYALTRRRARRSISLWHG